VVVWTKLVAIEKMTNSNFALKVESINYAIE
jgi:hypothetical protein